LANQLLREREESPSLLGVSSSKPKHSQVYQTGVAFIEAAPVFSHHKRPQ